ncbi:MAG: response regulator transcription factor [Kiritimatiellae bacterium]|nr:response regulator transcription factor [Kiritimatiellia bacterium]
MKILIVEDSQRLLRSLQVGLTKLGHAVDTACDGPQGLAFALHQYYDVIVLDLMLPGLDGLALLTELRRRARQTHVLILSARDQVEDRVRGLQLGADDYLVKPFDFDELCARLQALARRQHMAKNPMIAIGAMRINTSTRTVHIEDRPVALTAGEYAVLERLALNRGRVLSKEQIMDTFHDSQSLAGPNVVEVMICNLRRKLGAALRDTLKTRRGQGYIME